MGNPLSRRGFLTGLAAASLSSSILLDRRSSQAQSSPSLALNLPPYPFFPNLQSVMTEDRALLDQLLGAYARSTPTAQQHPIDFLSRYVPVYVFEQTLLPSKTIRPLLPQFLWLMHLAGYFGGVWLRDAFIRFPVPNSPNPRPGFPPNENSFAAAVARINTALMASNYDAAALAYAEGSLRGASLQGLVDSYGYNAGYLEQILTHSKPINAVAPANYFTYQGELLLDGAYSVPAIRPLKFWRSQVSLAASRSNSRYAAIVEGTGG